MTQDDIRALSLSLPGARQRVHEPVADFLSLTYSSRIDSTLAERRPALTGASRDPRDTARARAATDSITASRPG